MQSRNREHPLIVVVPASCEFNTMLASHALRMLPPMSLMANSIMVMVILVDVDILRFVESLNGEAAGSL